MPCWHLRDSPRITFLLLPLPASAKAVSQQQAPQKLDDQLQNLDKAHVKVQNWYEKTAKGKGKERHGSRMHASAAWKAVRARPSCVHATKVWQDAFVIPMHGATILTML